MDNIDKILKIKVAGGGNNVADFVIQQDSTVIPFSIKYKDGYGETDAVKLNATIIDEYKDYKIGLFVKDKDKNVVINHRFNNDSNINKQILDKIITDKLL